MANVTIDTDLCIGCGACTGIAPEVFGLNGEGKAAVIGEGAGAEDAAASCPVGAITVA